jgi:hypothetical protein
MVSQSRGLDPALAETLPHILSLLGIAGAGASLAMMDAGIRRRRTLEAVKRIIIRGQIGRLQQERTNVLPITVRFELDSASAALVECFKQPSDRRVRLRGRRRLNAAAGERTCCPKLQRTVVDHFRRLEHWSNTLGHLAQTVDVIHLSAHFAHSDSERGE